ncbi:hypothetical protein JCM8547_004465 [Rhodosporidiobolus lusitaniae]
MRASSLLLLAAPLAAVAAPAASFGSSLKQAFDLFASTAQPAIECGEGYTKGSVTNVAEFPVSIKKITPVINEFFTAEWEGFTVTNTTGKNNHPGALRSFSFGGIVPLTEELTWYIQTGAFVDRLWKGVGGKYAGDLPVVSDVFDIELESWTEHFTLTPLCENKATHFTWTAYYCSTNDAVAEQLYTGAHSGPYAALHDQFGNFTSC